MKLETPEQRWGIFEKPYHRTGEVGLPELSRNLVPKDYSNLEELLKNLYSVASEQDITLHVLLAGSAADLNSPSYSDIDLWIHVEQPEKRRTFANDSIKRLKKSSNFSVTTFSEKSSLILVKKLMGRPKALAEPVGENNAPQKGAAFDLYFADTEDESFEDILEFHRVNNLAFCELSGF